MVKYENEIYTLIDEKFISQFDDHHKQFMKRIYYNHYSTFCDRIGCTKASYDSFFSNMHRRRIYLTQQCCPYCGTIRMFLHDKRIHKNEGSLVYCGTCGRSSTSYTLFKHLSRFIRISGIVDDGLKSERKRYKDKEDWLLGFDCYQMELVELASIIEAVCRESFYALLFIKNMNLKNSFIKKAISKSVGNDFMNIEKANNHFKKAFDIDLKREIEGNVWDDLIDIVNLRNMMIHNNGRIDEFFKNTVSYNRLKSYVDDWMFRLDGKMVMNYFGSVMSAMETIIKVYLEQYFDYRNAAIANYYFNNSIINE